MLNQRSKNNFENKIITNLHPLWFFMAIIFSVIPLIACNTLTPPPTPTPLPLTKPIESPIIIKNPTSTKVSTKIPNTTACNNNSEFIADITIPDDSEINPSQAFVKTWRLQNNGNCTWTTGYELVFVDGDQLGAPFSIPITNKVKSDNIIKFSVNFESPRTPGTYSSTWQLRAPNGDLFGDMYWLRIVVPAPEAAIQSTTVATLSPELSQEGSGAIKSLKNILFFSPGGVGFQAACVAPPIETSFPKVDITRIDVNGNNLLRIWNFDLDEIITIELYINNEVYTGVYQVEESGDELRVIRISQPILEGQNWSGTACNYENGVTSLRMWLWWPVGLPTGQMRVVAKSANVESENNLEVGYMNNTPLISVVPAIGINPFERYRTLCFGGNSYFIGQEVVIMGTKFPPNSTLPFGIYKDELEQAELFTSTTITTDNQGNFSTSLSIDSSYVSGDYVSIAVIDSERGEYGRFEFGCFSVK